MMVRMEHPSPLGPKAPVLLGGGTSPSASIFKDDPSRH